MFAKKTVIITGSSSGIGARTALEFAKQGAYVTLHGRNEDDLEKVRLQCVDSGLSQKQVISVVGDITQSPVQTNLVDQSLKHFGQIDILVNNAGIVNLTDIDNFDGAAFDRLLQVNLKSVVELTMKCIPHLKKTKGCIINVSSAASVLALRGQIGYCVSKAALDMFTKCLASELAPFAVRVNSVNPGPTPTNLWRDYGPDSSEKREQLRKLVPMQRIGSTEETAQSILFLCSNQTCYTTGAIFPVDGGISTHTLFC